MLKQFAVKRIRIIAAAIAVLAVGSMAAPAVASAQTTTCKAGRFSPGLQHDFPAVYKLHARNLPRLTDGYAPRCLVAEGIAGSVQYYWSEHYRAPRHVDVMGARWYSGRWSIHYRVRTNGDASWGEFTARQGRKVVTWKGYS